MGEASYRVFTKETNSLCVAAMSSPEPLMMQGDAKADYGSGPAVRVETLVAGDEYYVQDFIPHFGGEPSGTEQYRIASQ